MLLSAAAFRSRELFPLEVETVELIAAFGGAKCRFPADELGPQKLCAYGMSRCECERSAIPQTAWTVVSADSQAPRYPAVAAFDGDTATFWHTAYAPVLQDNPHSLTLDLGAVYRVTGFQYLPRQDNGNRENGRIATYVFAVSLDGLTWSDGVDGTLANVVGAQTVSMSATPARYVRLTALSEVAGRPFTSIAELTVFQAEPPSNLVTPASRLAWEHDGSAGLVRFRLWVDGTPTTIRDLQQAGGSYTSRLPTMTAGEHILELAAYDATEQSDKVILRVVVEASAGSQ